MFIADFHIHSKYSRATSRECVPEVLEFWARRKGIGLIGTGDFTHPGWREELREKLVLSAEEGLYVLKDDFHKEDEIAGANCRPHFIVSGEISSIYKKNGKVRKVHNLILLPGLEHAESISRRLEAVGNLHSDGRPILGLDSRDLLELVLDLCPEAIFIPAHIWTPHFSLFGAYSGFDAITECFEDLTGHIFALETGLSSDPPMNWRLSALDNFVLVSNSDAHSPAKLGREANIFHTELSYQCIFNALKNRHAKEFYGTIEFFPEEGKYHYDGHRACKLCWKPAQTKAAGGRCSVCGGRITVGVLHRVEALADREEGLVPPTAKHFESLIPLNEVLAASLGYTVASKKVKGKYDDLLRLLGPEFFILREAALKDIELAAGPYIAEGIRRLRCGEVEIEPGFDGNYGKIKIMDQGEIDRLAGQLCFIAEQSVWHKKPQLPGSTDEDMKVPAAAGEPASLLTDPGLGSSGSVHPVDAFSPDPAHILYGLNEEQWEAVSSSGPAIAVIAGPGTGKTKTLVSRIAYLVEKCAVRPSQITAVTFTNKAAGEMRNRLEKHFADRRTAGAITIGTFHAICLQVLSKLRGQQNITLIDEYNALSLVEEILREMKWKISPREVMREISLLKNSISPAFPSGGGGRKTDTTAHQSVFPGSRFSEKEEVLFKLLYDLYCAQLERYGVMDYDDILLAALNHFAGGNTEAGSEGGLENPFTYLLVDEFQDINAIQYRLIKEWGRKCKSIFIIGDPDQSIYGFRGSDFRYFAKFKDDFPGIQYVRLTRNYRSTPQIIASASSVMAKKAAGGRTRHLVAKRAGGVQVRLIETNSEFSEALFITKEINRMVGGIDMLDAHSPSALKRKSPAAEKPRGFSDIAVLYRTNRQAEILGQCFAKEGIQYVVVGRDEFLADKPVREAVAFFRFLLNPGDIASLLVCLKAESAYAPELNEKILEAYGAAEKSLSSFLQKLEDLQLLPYEPGKRWKLIEMLRKYELIINKEKPWKILDSWIKDNNLTGVRSLELLLHTSLLHNEMSSFLQNLALGRESDIVRSGGKVYSPEAVSLMTMHAAKGLEFPVVFICGVNDGIIPLRNNKADLDLDEERRLFYVGMTRAEDELILLTSGTPSPFISDIKELIREDALTQKRPQYKQTTLFE